MADSAPASWLHNVFVCVLTGYEPQLREFLFKRRCVV